MLKSGLVGVFFTGAFFGVCCTLILGSVIPAVSLYHKAIYECQKSLPRDQHCKLVGVPVEKTSESK
jgi:hypothetical protein